MYAIIYLPTAEIVEHSDVYRPEGWFNTESRARAFIEGNVCLYKSYNRQYIHFISCNEVYHKEDEVPLHLLDVMEIPNV
jgi:hypothetical protein